MKKGRLLRKEEKMKIKAKVPQVGLHSNDIHSNLPY
jgi:hypothetical protein